MRENNEMRTDVPMVHYNFKFDFQCNNQSKKKKFQIKILYLELGPENDHPTN